MELWRIHIRPTGGLNDPALSYSLCLKNKVVGMGWPVAFRGKKPLSLGEYRTRAKARYRKDPSGQINTGLLQSISDNDLVWMRSPENIYHLCRVVGPWRYINRQQNLDADIVNIRAVEIVEVGPELNVPGSIINCFVPARTLQRIKNEDALDLSKLIWNRLSHYEYQCPTVRHDLFGLISAKDCEDLIYVYLQAKGWLVYPSKRNPDTLAYEFALKHRKDHRIAVVQVKTGNAEINLNKLPKSKTIDVAFAFQPNDRYRGNNPKAVIITAMEIRRFIKSNPQLLPLPVSVWLAAEQGLQIGKQAKGTVRASF